MAERGAAAQRVLRRRVAQYGVERYRAGFLEQAVLSALHRDADVAVRTIHRTDLQQAPQVVRKVSQARALIATRELAQRERIRQLVQQRELEIESLDPVRHCVVVQPAPVVELGPEHGDECEEAALESIFAPHAPKVGSARDRAASGSGRLRGGTMKDR
jgi:hypothetical protein